MTRHYTTRDFFRQMPNALLARYFQRRDVLADLDFATLKETKPDELFAAWMELPDSLRNGMDAEFKIIFEMSCENGFCAIRDEAAWHLDEEPLAEFVEKLAALANHAERSMITYLDHNEFWKGATLFYHADTLSHWRKRKNLPHGSAATDPSSLDELAHLMRTYFHRTEGRGNNCIVEPYRRGDLIYYFAYPEDYSQHGVEWVNGTLDRRPHNPAFEVIYVYSRKKGALDVKFRGSTKAIEPLQSMFATAILKLTALPPDPKDGRVYDLDQLSKRGFSFLYEPESGIQSIVLRKIRLSSRVRKGDRITLEADTSSNPNAIYDLLDKIGLSPNLFHVTQVELAAMIISEVGKPPKTVTIRITYPNSCSLKYDELDLRLREMLEASGIEPKDPEQESDEEEPVEA